MRPSPRDDPRGTPVVGMTRVLIADPQLLLADALATALAGHDDLEVVDEQPETARDALAAVLRHQPDVALLNYRLRQMNGPALLLAVQVQAPNVKVITLSSWLHSPHDIQTALDCGAVGFVPTEVRVATIVEAIRRARSGENPVFEDKLADMAGRLQSRQDHVSTIAARLARLTPRQLEVLRLIAAGMDATTISKRLNISMPTVRSHIHSMLELAGAQSQVELISMARDHGVV